MTVQSESRTSAQGWMLRAESFAIIAVTLAIYAAYDFSWLLLVVLFLVPDLAMLGYLFGNRVGAAVYNVVHVYATPLAFGGLAFLFGWHLGIQLALIWVLHIAVDRLVGYGLKYGNGFKETHLGRV